MARALVRRPRAYLFDDCFSALDYATDARVRAALPAWAAGSTVILVAQRISTVLAAIASWCSTRGASPAWAPMPSFMESCPEYREIACRSFPRKNLWKGVRDERATFHHS